MSSLFDVPAQLVLVLTLAASGGEPAAAPRTAVTPTPVAAVVEAAAIRPIPFREQTWLAALESGAGGEPLAAEASRIFRTSGGRYYVPVASERQRILELRKDADIAALVAFGQARRHAETLRAALKRSPTASDLYLAHVLGADRSIALISSAASDQDRLVSDVLPGLADDWPELRPTGGRAASVGALVARLKLAIERRPTGAEVAQWFGRARRSLGGDIAARGEEERPSSGNGAEASSSSWQTVVLVD
ncbi:MAG: hypothetical protein ACT4N2_04690 [Hyphomicrobium sp.]